MSLQTAAQRPSCAAPGCAAPADYACHIECYFGIPMEADETDTPYLCQFHAHLNEASKVLEDGQRGLDAMPDYNLFTQYMFTLKTWPRWGATGYTDLATDRKLKYLPRGGFAELMTPEIGGSRFHCQISGCDERADVGVLTGSTPGHPFHKIVKGKRYPFQADVPDRRCLMICWDHREEDIRRREAIAMDEAYARPLTWWKPGYDVYFVPMEEAFNRARRNFHGSLDLHSFLRAEADAKAAQAAAERMLEAAFPTRSAAESAATHAPIDRSRQARTEGGR